MKYNFRKNPDFINKLKISSTTNDKNKIMIEKLSKNIKIGSFQIGNSLASVWFGVFLFAMQSYFLRQNLKLTDRKFISD
jgi:hypothetical protein